MGGKLATIQNRKQYTMTPERIKEIHSLTAYPESISVRQALLQVWNECEQDNKELRGEVRKLREGLEDCDTLLAHLEDYAHGDGGKMITQQRGKIQQLLTETEG